VTASGQLDLPESYFGRRRGRDRTCQGALYQKPMDRPNFRHEVSSSHRTRRSRLTALHLRTHPGKPGRWLQAGRTRMRQTVPFTSRADSCSLPGYLGPRQVDLSNSHCEFGTCRAFVHPAAAFNCAQSTCFPSRTFLGLSSISVSITDCLECFSIHY
jgi:hypothetical protein